MTGRRPLRRRSGWPSPGRLVRRGGALGDHGGAPGRVRQVRVDRGAAGPTRVGPGVLGGARRRRPPRRRPRPRRPRSPRGLRRAGRRRRASPTRLVRPRGLGGARPPALPRRPARGARAARRRRSHAPRRGGRTPPAADRRRGMGALVAVTGAGGAGISTIAAALARASATTRATPDGRARRPGARRRPGACCTTPATWCPASPSWSMPTGWGSRRSTRSVPSPSMSPARGYRLLLGLRRHRDWATLRPRAVAAAIDGLRRAFRSSSPTSTPDLEGEDAVRLGRRRGPQRPGAHSPVHCIRCRRGRAAGTEGHAPDAWRHHRPPRARCRTAPRPDRGQPGAAWTACPGRDHPGLRRAQWGPPRGARLASPIFVPERRQLDGLVNDGHRLPAPFCRTITTAVAGLLAVAGTQQPAARTLEPVPVSPGSLPTWTDVSG